MIELCLDCKYPPESCICKDRHNPAGMSKAMQAHEFLESGLGHMKDRAATYDAPQGERSMGKTASMFHTLYAEQLAAGEFTEEMGWGFMVILKLVRTSQGDFRADNYEDGCAYFGLMGEAASKT